MKCSAELDAKSLDVLDAYNGILTSMMRCDGQAFACVSFFVLRYLKQ